MDFSERMQVPSSLHEHIVRVSNARYLKKGKKGLVTFSRTTSRSKGRFKSQLLIDCEGCDCEGPPFAVGCWARAQHPTTRAAAQRVPSILGPDHQSTFPLFADWLRPARTTPCPLPCTGSIPEMRRRRGFKPRLREFLGRALQSSKLCR